MSPQSTIDVLSVAFDAMGGYDAPETVVKAAARASLRQDFHSILVGDTARIDSILVDLAHNPERLSVAHASGAVPMAVRPEDALDLHPESSLERCAQLVGSGKADAIVTSGNPGVAVLAMRRHVSMLSGVERAAVAAVVPTRRRRGKKEDPFSLLLDVGATDHATADELVTFAVMGAAYARCISHNTCPRVALLSNSREATVGPSAVVEAHARLTAMSDDRHFTFIGNVEGHQLPSGDADVVVCEGFVGAILVRLLEGIAETAVDIARAAYGKRLKWRLGLSMLSGGLEQLRQLTDWKEYGGAPLLGFDCPIIVTHASSGERAVLNAAKVAVKTVRDRVVQRIEDNLR